MFGQETFTMAFGSRSAGNLQTYAAGRAYPKGITNDPDVFVFFFFFFFSLFSFLLLWSHVPQNKNYERFPQGEDHKRNTSRDTHLSMPIGLQRELGGGCTVSPRRLGR